MVTELNTYYQQRTLDFAMAVYPSPPPFSLVIFFFSFYTAFHFLFFSAMGLSLIQSEGPEEHSRI